MIIKTYYSFLHAKSDHGYNLTLNDNMFIEYLYQLGTCIKYQIFMGR